MNLEHYEDRELLLSRAQDLQWTDDVSGFECVRCEKVLIRHYIANCGHKFCFNCKKLVGDGSKRWRCPVKECNKFIEDIHLQDGFFEETVFELNTHCPNHKYGCPIIGPLKDIERHLSKCEDTRENAMPILYKENKQMNDIQMLKKMSEMSEKIETMNSTVTEMQKAMSEMREEKSIQEKMGIVNDRMWLEMERKLKGKTENWLEMLDYKDKKYTEKIKQLEIKMEKIDEISTLKKECNSMSAQNLLLTNQFQQSKQKENELQNEIDTINKKLSELNGMLDIKDKKHNEKINQLEIEVKKISKEHQDEISILKKKLSDFSGRDEALEKSISLLKPPINYHEYTTHEADFTWIINSIQSKVKRTNLELLSPIFPLKGYPFAAQAKLTFNKTNNSLYIALSYKDINENGKKLDLKLIPAVHYTLKEQSSNAKIIRRESNYVFTSVFQYNEMDYRRKIIESNKLVSDAISIDIHVEKPEVIQQGYSYDGSITWAIDDFREKREGAKEDLVWFYPSPYFYTSPKGYRVAARMWLNGWMAYKGKGLTIDIDFLTGPYDADLSRSFKHETTVTLLHPYDSTKHVVKSAKQNIKKKQYYMINMGTHAEIEKLLDNDTLYYQINIVPA